MRNLTVVIAVFLCSVCFVSTALAQAKEIDTGTADKIVDTGIMGLSVTTITELLKRQFKVSGVGAYAISGVVSAVATGSWLMAAGQFAWDSLGIFGTMVFFVANGFYKFVRKEPA